jgi:3-deoxy-manno-octulosonate cytidylyltransferase (CMP-KDO synthetase)
VHRVKVVVDGDGRALRFSRRLPASGAWACEVEVRHHIGIYAYERRALLRWAALPEVAAERADGLEQQRPLAHGIPIGVATIDTPAPPSVDTEEDLVAAERYAETMSQRVGR